MDGRAVGARDLVLAIFRLAVCDYLGLSYGHDAVDRPRRVHGCFSTEAGKYLTSAHAMDLAGLAGFRSELVWRQAQAMREQAEVENPSTDGWRLAA